MTDRRDPLRGMKLTRRGCADGSGRQRLVFQVRRAGGSIRTIRSLSSQASASERLK
jgi:hypothetical protein